MQRKDLKKGAKYYIMSLDGEVNTDWVYEAAEPIYANGEIRDAVKDFKVELGIPVSIPINTEVCLTSTEDFCQPDIPLKGGIKHDSNKPPWSLLPFDGLEEVVKVLGYGATKYDAHNWRNGFKYSRLSDAALRHLTSFIRGEDKDPETNLSHLAHAVCCLLFLLEHTQKGYGTDDRYIDKK